MTAEHRGGDEHWDRFVKDFEASRSIPATASRTQTQTRADAAQASTKPKRRRGRRLVATAVVLAGLAGAGYWFGPWRHADAHPAARPTGNASTASAPAVAAIKATNPAGSATALTAITPDQAFPAAVGNYLKVRQFSLPLCTQQPAVQATLAGLVTQSHGCLGISFALYSDPAKDEYTVAVLTMKDPADAVTVLTTLSADPTSFQIGRVIPPSSSGLTHLPEDSGAVQQFASGGHLVIIGLALWSDGHAGDYQKLEDQLTPLFSAVTKQAESHDTH
ncbi:flagellar basal body-associated FliL family protein [Streptacidiphilus fuscans]|uniref:Uncharacterized protein n=1 Tax=Streptacidiphilus fuscans TaxID=2789292 RepID=A0A931FF46_9ACTN|nr:hypothetical protein [Streptacidiphilus fuscans]MBF9068074.1 hypothetical protein [Streptacidiphilus fuscans]